MSEVTSDVSSWSEEQVAVWLESKGLGIYKEKFIGEN